MVRLVQLLCPQRHSIIAAAYEEGSSTFDQVVRMMEKRVRELGINGWCGICGSHDLRYEEARTKAKTLAEIMPALKEAEASNLATRAALNAAGETYDQKLRN